MSTRAATGRPRPVGPIAPGGQPLRRFCQGRDEVALTLLDVLDYMETVPAITAYQLTDGTTTTRFPMGRGTDTAKPVVVICPAGTATLPAHASGRTCLLLPRTTSILEQAVGCKITYISVGAEREAIIRRA